MPHLRETHPSRRPVVVGVDGSRAACQAVRWGAVEARLRAAKLLLVHVGSPAADAVGLDHTSPPGDAILRTSAEVAAETEPEIGLEMVSTTSESVSEELVRISHDAEVLALGIDLARTRSSHGARGPLEDRVAVHAGCPVAVVAPLSFIAPGARTQVTVGWTDNHTADLALHAAAEEAVLRDVALSIVTVPPPFDQQLAGIIDPPNHESALIESVAALEVRHPGLVIDISHRTGDVSQALGAMASVSELLVIGCHHSDQPWSIRTGPVAEAVMRMGHCPVMLVGRRAKQRGPRSLGASSRGTPMTR